MVLMSPRCQRRRPCAWLSSIPWCPHTRGVAQKFNKRDCQRPSEGPSGGQLAFNRLLDGRLWVVFMATITRPHAQINQGTGRSQTMDGHTPTRLDEATIDSAWRPPKPRDRAEAVREQNSAAGGADARRITLPDGTMRNASIELKRVHNFHRIYAYLRYSVGGKTVSVYVGEVTGRTRLENLEQAWFLAHTRELLVSNAPRA